MLEKEIIKINHYSFFIGDPFNDEKITCLPSGGYEFSGVPNGEVLVEPIYKKDKLIKIIVTFKKVTSILI